MITCSSAERCWGTGRNYWDSSNVQPTTECQYSTGGSAVSWCCWNYVFLCSLLKWNIVLLYWSNSSLIIFIFIILYLNCHDVNSHLSSCMLINNSLYLYITYNDAFPRFSYRALYNYKPQNEDELELKEGDVVMVMEKCDDGWYVGTSRRTSLFGTFPGNYVERMAWTNVLLCWLIYKSPVLG